MHIAEVCSLTPTVGGIAKRRSTRDHAALARTSQAFYHILNPTLYRNNAVFGAQVQSYLYWAAQYGSIDTLVRAKSYGLTNIDPKDHLYGLKSAEAKQVMREFFRRSSVYSEPFSSMESSGEVSLHSLSRGSSPEPTMRTPRLWSLATPLYISLLYRQIDVFEWLLDNDADPHTLGPWLQPFGSYMLVSPMAIAFDQSPGIPRAVEALIRHGVFFMTYEDGVRKPLILDLTFRYEEDDEQVEDGGDAENNAENKVKREAEEVRWADLLVQYRGAEETSACLMYAAQRRDKHLFRELLQRPEADCSRRDNRGATVLHWVCGSFGWTWWCEDAESVIHFNLEQRSGRIRLLELLLERQDVDIIAADQNGWNGLHFACLYRDFETATILLSRHAGLADKGDHCGRTPLHVCGYSGSFRIADFLLKRSSSIVSVDQADFKGRTALHYASMGDSQAHFELMEYLLNQGADINHLAPPHNTQAAMDSDEHVSGTPLHCAMKAGCYRAGLALARHGAHTGNGLMPDSEMNLIHCCLQHRASTPNDLELQYELLKFLIESGQNVNSVCDWHFLLEKCGASPLLRAAVDVQSTRCMRLLIEKGADVNMQLNWFNRMESWYDGKESLLSMLLRSSEENTQELEATGDSKVRRIKLLLEHGARLDKQLLSEDPPLTYAVEVSSLQTAVHENEHVELVLSMSNRDNVRLVHVQDVISECENRQTGGAQGSNLQTSQRNFSDIVKLLKDFCSREWPDS